MDFHVRIVYSHQGHGHVFRRAVKLDPDTGTLSFLARAAHGDGGNCPSCLERLRFVLNALSVSGASHVWDGKQERVTFRVAGAMTEEEALDFLRQALPTAESIEFGG